MIEMDKLKELMEINEMNIHTTQMECNKYRKDTTKYMVGTIIFGAASAFLFSGLRIILQESDLVLVCTPTIIGMVTSSTMMAVSNRKTHNCYSKLRDLDIEKFDLSLEYNLRKKGIAFHPFDVKDLNDENNIAVNSEEEYLSSEIEKSEDIHHHSPKRMRIN